MATLPKILVTGSNGQLGKELKRLADDHSQYEFIFLGREDLPIHHFEMVRQYFSVYQPAYLINCAAYTAVDRAEQEKDLAMQVNGEAVGVLAAVCKENNCRFIHISTDYVFDGTATTPYKEEDCTNPQSVYGASKLEGEKQALLLNPQSVILRTSWVYSEYGKNFVKTMLTLMKDRPEIKVVNDQYGSPTYAADLAEAILDIIAAPEWKPGIYHYSNDGIITWYELATAIAELSGYKGTVHPITTAEYPTPAKRPAWSVLDKTKIQQAYPVKINDWKQSLEHCLARLR